jgi:hypothetical protein
MFYFRKRKILIESAEEVEKLLNQSTSKVLTMFDLSATSSYIILAERPLMGQKLSNGETIISRHRHTILQVVPRIVTRWRIETLNGQSFLVLQNRLALLPTIALLMIFLPLALGISKSLANLELPDLEIVGFSLTILALYLVLAFYELRSTDKTIQKVISNEKVKSLVTI